VFSRLAERQVSKVMRTHNETRTKIQSADDICYLHCHVLESTISDGGVGGTAAAAAATAVVAAAAVCCGYCCCCTVSSFLTSES
jgi:hypothetical protein